LEQTLKEAIEAAYKAIGKDPKKVIYKYPKKEKSKKLTTKDRKKLKKSVYCGPDKSFPCNDCKHVAIAKTYLARSKFSKATKEKIAACINRRAKELKCNVSKLAKAEVKTYITMDKDERKLYNSKIFNTTRKLVNSSFREEGADLDFLGCC